jgi:hypothetical protein
VGGEDGRTDGTCAKVDAAQRNTRRGKAKTPHRREWRVTLQFALTNNHAWQQQVSDKRQYTGRRKVGNGKWEAREGITRADVPGKPSVDFHSLGPRRLGRTQMRLKRSRGGAWRFLQSIQSNSSKEGARSGTCRLCSRWYLASAEDCRLQVPYLIDVTVLVPATVRPGTIRKGPEVEGTILALSSTVNASALQPVPSLGGYRRCCWYG